MRKIRNIILLTMLIAISNKISVQAHGNTYVESHKDYLNESGFGYGQTHYHHGYEAHLHPGGVCKYRETEKQNLAIKQGNDDGYEYGYLGIDKVYSYLEDEAYYAMYKKAYDESYNEGKNKAEAESKEYYNKGKELGKSGKSLDRSYNNKIFDKAYKNGYEEGYKEYKLKVEEEYRQKGIRDGKIYENKISFDGLEGYMIDAYEKGYSEGLSEYIKEIKYIGYSAAFGNANGNPSYTEDERKWYNEGLNEGNAKLKEIKEEAKKLGFEGKDESVLDKFTEGKTQALEAFKIGEAERLKQEQIKKEKENKMNLFKYGMIIAMGITTVSIGFVLNKMKKSRTNEAIDDNVA